MARREDRLRALAEEITGAGGRALAAPGDVTRSGDVRRVAEATVEAFGSLDCAFNNAGYATVEASLHETDDEVYDRTMNVRSPTARSSPTCAVAVPAECGASTRSRHGGHEPPSGRLVMPLGGIGQCQVVRRSRMR